MARHVEIPPPRRGLRSSKVVGRGEDDTIDNTPSELEPTEGTSYNMTPRRLANTDGVNHMETVADSSLMFTPQVGASSSTPFGTAVASSRPMTRSSKKGYFDSILVNSPSIQNQVQDRLLLGTAGSSAQPTTVSNLEEAPDIDYGIAEGNIVEDHDPRLENTENDPVLAEPQDNGQQRSHPTVSGLSVPRRSDRIRAQSGGAREPSPLTTLAASSKNNRVQKRRKRSLVRTNKVAASVRRSARLAKPLDIFHKYAELPPELQLMIWEAAVEPRITYICNRSSILEHAHHFGIQNRRPSWFMACRMSAYIASRRYQKLFGQNGMNIHPPLSWPLPQQDINPSMDIVVFEPCHSGCRAYYCAQQYSKEDRATVQKLAVQIDSPHLLPTSEPGWATISRSWPSVETLFMMKQPVKGLDQRDKAMIRIREGDYEVVLRKLFDQWKKEDGQHHKLTTLEFVRVVEQEPQNKNIKDRYGSVEDRKTGLAEDIILG